MQEYQHSQPQHMVLVQDVKFLADLQRAQVLGKEREVVDAFAQAIAALKPRLRKKALRVPLAMILFGMINWTFTWLRAEGPLTYEDMAAGGGGDLSARSHRHRGNATACRLSDRRTLRRRTGTNRRGYNDGPGMNLVRVVQGRFRRGQTRCSLRTLRPRRLCVGC